MPRSTVQWETTHRIIVEKSNHNPPIYKAQYLDTNVFAYLKSDWKDWGHTAEEAILKLLSEYPRDKRPEPIQHPDTVG